MDLKKAKLDDDAALYNQEEQKTPRQRWKEMNKAERKSYFFTYYFKPLIFTILVLIFVGTLIYNYFKPKAEIILSVAVNDFPLVDFDKITSDYIEQRGFDSTQKTVATDTAYNLSGTRNASERLMVYAMAGDLDIFICGHPIYENYASSDFLLPLDDLLDEETIEFLTENDYAFVSKIVKKGADGSVLSVGEEHIYGIYLDKHERFKNYTLKLRRPVVGIVKSTPRQTEAVEYIKFLIEGLRD